MDICFIHGSGIHSFALTQYVRRSSTVRARDAYITDLCITSYSWSYDIVGLILRLISVEISLKYVSKRTPKQETRDVLSIYYCQSHIFISI
jgi:hypothetical protein